MEMCFGAWRGACRRDVFWREGLVREDWCGNFEREGMGMNVGEMLDEIKGRVRRDPGLYREFLETRQAKDPLAAFCGKCRELGYEIYEMDLVGAGEAFYAEIKRSTNGGGENSPVLAGEDDFYEMFFADLG